LATGFRRCDVRDYNHPFSSLLRLGGRARLGDGCTEICVTTDLTQLRLMSGWSALIAAARSILGKWRSDIFAIGWHCESKQRVETEKVQ
jgi:hypothetical protein